MNSVYENTTICARSTASAEGAIAIVRTSGKDSFDIVSKIFRKPSCSHCDPSSFHALELRKVHFGNIVNPFDDSILDEVLVVKFKSPASFTGEDMVEIYCHGSEYIVSSILKLLIANGATNAAPGEFSQRAFLNGRMDLAQAEAVADLIASTTKAAHDIAMNQMKGGYSGILTGIREELLKIVSLMELELDFSEEDVEFADRSHLKKLCDSTLKEISNLADSFGRGDVIKNGVPVAIVGATNTGKSTLLNALYGEERAIVSDIEGTTRDTIEEQITIDGVRYRIIDTAGIRSTKETIEIIGIERTFSTIDKATLILMVLDATRSEYYSEALKTLSSRINSPKHIFVLLNKCDCIDAQRIENDLRDISQLCSECGITPKAILPISAAKHEITDLIKAISESGHELSFSENETLVTSLRHFEALNRSKASLQRVREALDTDTFTEFITQDLRESIYHIGTITGQITNDEILGSIFSKFCIGK